MTGQMAGQSGGMPLAGLLGLVLWGVVVAAVVVGSMHGFKAGWSAAARLDYPAAPPGPVVDHYHGVAVADPWRWLEDLNSPQTLSWVAAQNQLTERYLAQLPRRAKFARRLRTLLDYERRGVPERENGVYVYAWNPGQAEQDVLRVTRDLSQPGRVLVDPRVLRADGTVAVADFA